MRSKKLVLQDKKNKKQQIKKNKKNLSDLVLELLTLFVSIKMV